MAPDGFWSTNNRKNSTPFDHDADVQMLAKGGEVEDHGEGPMVGNEENGMKDPSEIPDDIREYIDKAHKQIRESRPDENWHIKPAEKKEPVAPYKKQEDEEKGWESLATNVREEGPGANEEIPGYDEGGQTPDPNQDLSDIAKMGGMAPGVPLPAAQPPMPAPVAAPMATPPPMPAPKPPMPPVSAATAPTDEDFMARANKMLGLNPDQQAGFMKLLGDNAQKGQIGAGIAGIGDAIAAGGTLGKVNPGGMARSEDLIQGKTKEGLEGLQMIRGNQEKAYDVGEKIRGNEPFSPEIQKSLVSQFHIPPALSGAPRDVIYKMLDPIAQTQLKEAELAQANEFKKATLDFQKQQLQATEANAAAERANAAKETGLKTDTEAAKHFIMHPELAAAARQRLAAGTSGAQSDRVTVVSPTGQIGHIPAAQLKDAIAKGYKQQ